MADFGVTAAVAISAIAAAGSAAAAHQASVKQNKAAKAAAKTAQEAAARQAAQIKSAAKVEKGKAIQTAEQVIGRVRVAAAGAGFEDAGSYQAFIRQAAADAETNVNIIDRNANNAVARVQSGLDADLTQLNSRIVSPVLAAFTAGLSGANSGLAISNAAMRLSDGSTAPAATTATGERSTS